LRVGIAYHAGMEKPLTPLDRACKAAGGVVELARKLGIKPPSISEWKARKRVPAERVLDVERLTGVSRHDLRPDIFGPAPTDREAA